MRLRTVVNYKDTHKKQLDSFLKESFTDILVDNTEEEEKRHNALVGLAYDTMDFYDLFDAIENETGNPQADILNALADQTDEELVNGLIYYVNNNDYDNEEKVHLAKELKKITGKDYFNALNITLVESTLKENLDTDAEKFKNWFEYFLMLEEINPERYYEIHDKYDMICSDDSFWDSDEDYNEVFKKARPRTQKRLLNLIKEYPIKMNESCTLKVFNKEGKQIDNQPGFKSSSDAYAFLDSNDDKYPAGYTYKVLYNESKKDKSKELLTECCLKVFNKRKNLKEKLEEKDFDYILSKRETDPEFKKITDTKLKDLPEKCKFSFGEDFWEDCLDDSLFEIYERAYVTGSLRAKSKLILSENDKEPLGWVLLNFGETNKIIISIKFGSFYPNNSLKNREFLQQLLIYISQELKNYDRVCWFASKENPFARHYIDIIKKYNGSVNYMPGDLNYLEFVIGKNFNIENALFGRELDNLKTTKDITEALNKKNGYSKKDLKESEEAPSREELKAKVRQYMINSMKDEEWEPEDKELWKSIDWKARNYEDYPVEDDSFEGDVYYYDHSGKHIEPGKFIKYIRSNPNFPPYYSATPNNDKKGTWGMYDGRKHGKYQIHDRRESWDLNKDLSD